MKLVTSWTGKISVKMSILFSYQIAKMSGISGIF